MGGACGAGCGHGRHGRSGLGAPDGGREAGHEDRVVDVRASLLGTAVAHEEPCDEKEAGTERGWKGDGKGISGKKGVGWIER